MRRRYCVGLLVLWLLLAGCSSGASTAPVAGTDRAESRPTPEAVAPAPGAQLRVVATTSIVADVVAQIGGDRITLHTLLPPGTDPHSYQPTPQDLRAVADAHVVFTNGLGLEGFLDRVIVNAGADLLVTPVSAGIRPRTGGEEGVDPHVWMDVRNVADVWVPNIERTLSQLDAAHAGAYRAAAEAYRAQLTQLDADIREMVARIPAGRRVLVTDHDVFGYFAEAYGFRVVGAVIPGLSTLAEPSAQQLAALQEQIRSEGVPAIFVGTTVNPALAQQLAQDLDIAVVPVYTGSLSSVEGPASTYIDFMRTNVAAMVEALAP